VRVDSNALQMAQTQPHKDSTPVTKKEIRCWVHLRMTGFVQSASQVQAWGKTRVANRSMGIKNGPYDQKAKSERSPG